MTRESPRGRSRLPQTEDPGFYEALGRAIKVARTEQGLSRKLLAEAAGVSYPYLADIESGRGRPSSRPLLAIAQALEMTPSELFARAESFVHRMREEGAPATPAAMLPARPSRRWFQAEAPVAAMASPPVDMEPSAPGGRDELHRLIDQLPDEDVPLALEIARRLLGEGPQPRA